MNDNCINPYKLFRGAFVPNIILERSDLSALAKLVYSCLSDYNIKATYPGLETLIAEKVGAKKYLVKQAIKQLVERELI